MARARASGKARRRTSNGHRSQATGAPLWLWLSTGIAAVLLLAFLYYLATIPPGKDAGTGRAETRSKHRGQSEGVKFNFYTLLPQRKVETPAVNTQPSARKQTPPASPAKQHRTDVQYFLQAGSFRHRQQAEKRRVQLLLLDTDSEINKVRRSGDAWYRVQVGPLESRSQLASIRGKLLSEGIDTLVSTRPKDPSTRQ